MCSYTIINIKLKWYRNAQDNLWNLEATNPPLGAKSWVQDRKNAGSARGTFINSGNFPRVRILVCGCKMPSTNYADSWKATIYIERHYRRTEGKNKLFKYTLPQGALLINATLFNILMIWKSLRWRTPQQVRAQAAGQVTTLYIYKYWGEQKRLAMRDGERKWKKSKRLQC